MSENTCPNTGLQCVPSCNQRECAGLHTPLNQWPKPASPVAKKDSPLEQLAQRFEIYASDIEAMLKHGYSMKGGKAHQHSRVATFLAVAAELRTIETQMLEQDRILLVCSASTRLPVAE